MCLQGRTDGRTAVRPYRAVGVRPYRTMGVRTYAVRPYFLPTYMP